VKPDPLRSMVFMLAWPAVVWRHALILANRCSGWMISSGFGTESISALGPGLSSGQAFPPSWSHETPRSIDGVTSPEPIPTRLADAARQLMS